MKVEHVIYSIDKSGGGPSRSVTHLLEVMGNQYPTVNLHLFTAKTENPILESFNPSNRALTLMNTNRIGMLEKYEDNSMKFSPDLFHGQAIWDLPVHQMAKLARRKNKPYVITPRGMLEPWSLSQKKWKKKIALWLYQNEDLRKASCLHATAVMEAQSFRKLGFTNPIAIIPNGVPIEEYKIKDFKTRTLNKKILFLSRIHEKKGLEFLILAWSQLPQELKKGWVIDIVGNGDSDYIESLRRKILNLGLSNEICIKPPIYGTDKLDAYQEADLFVLPTFSENFGIVIAEALAAGTPVITTKGAPWEDLEIYNCGWYIDIGEEPLRKALVIALTTTEIQYEKMGRNGRKLIEEKYSMEAVANNMYELYEWLLDKCEKPKFVRIN